LNASLFFETRQLLAFRLFLRSDTGGNSWSPPLLDHDGATGVPVNLGIPGEVDLNMDGAVSIFRE